MTVSIGDCVRLKSGGPLMVVSSQDKRNGWESLYRYWCKWFSDDNVTVNVESFPGRALEKVKVGT